jgi:hypothetical protein
MLQQGKVMLFIYRNGSTTGLNHKFCASPNDGLIAKKQKGYPSL